MPSSPTPQAGAKAAESVMEEKAPKSSADFMSPSQTAWYDQNSPEPAAEVSPEALTEAWADEEAEPESDSLSDSTSQSTVLSTAAPPSAVPASPTAAGEDPSASLRAALRTANVAKLFVSRKAAHPKEDTTPQRSSQRKSIKADLDDHLKPASHPFGKPSLAQQRRNVHREMAEHMDDQPDIENVLKFCCWGKDHFTVLYELFRYPDASGKYMSCRAVPVEEFVLYLATSGFKGNGLSIVSEIYKCAPPGVMAQMSHNSIGAPAYEITMPMLHKFIRTNQHLTEGLEWSPVNEFKRDLLQNRGSYLRAWRLDLDLQNTGTVPYMTFIQACHKLQHGHHSQAIWDAFRAESTNAPLEFADFAPEEAANLDAFTQTLWVSCDFNMCKAWEVIDVTERLWVSEREFVEGAAVLGFDGDATRMYRGLDTYGHGRLWRRELEYLKTMFNASSRTPHGTPQMKVLRAWARASFGGPEGFLTRLGMGPGQDDVMLSPDQLVAGLRQLAYPGDCVQTANLVARSTGLANGISKELLVALVSGARPPAPPYIQRTIKAMNKVRRSRSSPTLTEQHDMEKGWNGSVMDLGLRNEDKPAVSRSYFSYPRPLQSGEVAPRFRSTTPRKAWALPGQEKNNFKVQPTEEELKEEKRAARREKEKLRAKKKNKPSAVEEESAEENSEEEAAAMLAKMQSKMQKTTEKKDKKAKKEKKEKKAKPIVDEWQEEEEEEEGGEADPLGMDGLDSF